MSDEHPPNHLDSYDCVLRAKEDLHVHDPQNHLNARECLQEVVAPDSADHIVEGLGEAGREESQNGGSFGRGKAVGLEEEMTTWNPPEGTFVGELDYLG